jgi:hypothetical protein
VFFERFPSQRQVLFVHERLCCLQAIVASSSGGVCPAPEMPLIALLDLLLEFCENNLHRVTASGAGFPLEEFLFELGKFTLLQVAFAYSYMRSVCCLHSSAYHITITRCFRPLCIQEAPPPPSPSVSNTLLPCAVCNMSDSN